MSKVWQVKLGGRQEFGSVEHVVRALLRQRGVNKEGERGFFELKYDSGIHDPYLMADMELAVDRIFKAIEREEHILIYGDYDVDGISSTAVLMSVLKDLGASVSPFIPHRGDNGYGLDKAALEEMINSFDLLVTVDCGVSNREEIDWLSKKGKDVIVTDHHVVPEALPDALAVVHPAHPQGEYPFAHLAGVGVSWKLAAGLLLDERCKLGDADWRIKELIDLVCLGTIADMVPLVGENRVIVKYGLKLLANSGRPGVRALVDSLGGGSVSVESVSYRLGPLLNAAGRVKHAQPALDLLLEESGLKVAQYMEQLVGLNNKRRRLERAIQQAADQFSGETESVVFAADASWPVGVLGVVAGRLSEKYKRPAVVVGGVNGRLVGSARAPEGVSVLQVLREGKSLFSKFGGHERAAGFTLKNGQAEDLRDVLLKAAGQLEFKAGRQEAKQADMVLGHELVNWDMLDGLQRMEPFGQDNEQPRFVWRDVYLGDWRMVGKTGEHVKMAFNMNDDLVDGIGFGLARTMSDSAISPKEVVDVLGCLEVNEYNGRRMLQVKVLDIEKAGKVGIIENRPPA